MIAFIINFVKMIAFAAAGVYLLVYPLETLYSVIYVFGLVIGVYGLFTCLGYLLQRKDADAQNRKSIFSFVIGIIALACGAYTAFNPNVVSESFPFVAGMFVLATGILSLMEAIVGRNGFAYWKYDMAFSIATIVIGIILMFCTFDQVTTVRMLGTVMVYLGAVGAVENRSGK